MSYESALLSKERRVVKVLSTETTTTVVSGKAIEITITEKEYRGERYTHMHQVINGVCVYDDVLDSECE